jgi:hypothetical protein
VERATDVVFEKIEEMFFRSRGLGGDIAKEVKREL